MVLHEKTFNVLYVSFYKVIRLYKVIRFYSGRSGLRRARARRSLGAEEVDKAARGRTPVDGGASGCFTSTTPAGAESPRQLGRRLTQAMMVGHLVDVGAPRGWVRRCCPPYPLGVAVFRAV